jgi:hypothetical protein
MRPLPMGTPYLPFWAFHVRADGFVAASWATASLETLDVLSSFRYEPTHKSPEPRGHLLSLLCLRAQAPCFREYNRESKLIRRQIDLFRKLTFALLFPYCELQVDSLCVLIRRFC